MATNGNGSGSHLAIHPPPCHKRWNASRPLRRIVVSFCLSDCSLECCILLPKSPPPSPSQLPLPLPSPIILIITVVVVAHPAPGKRVHTHVRLLSSLIMGPCAIRPCIWTKMWVMFGTRYWPEQGTKISCFYSDGRIMKRHEASGIEGLWFPITCSLKFITWISYIRHQNQVKITLPSLELLLCNWLNGHTFCFLAAACDSGCAPVRITGNWKSVALCATSEHQDNREDKGGVSSEWECCGWDLVA